MSDSIKLAGSVLAALLLAGSSAAAQQKLESLGQAYRDQPTPQRRASLEAYAKAHPKDAGGAMAHFTLGIVAYQQKNLAGALGNFKIVRARLPKLADYADYYTAAARVDAQDYARVPKDLEAAMASSPVTSPLAGRAWALEARALTAASASDQALQLLRQHYSELPQPDGDLALAAAYEGTHDLFQAAKVYQQVYYQYPSGEAANRAGAALVTLRDTMGTSYPPPLPRQMLDRVNRMLAERDYVHARREYESLAQQLSGTDRDMARVGIGAARFLAGDLSAAYLYLRGLQVSEGEPDAQRLYYMAECARRKGDDDEMMDAVKHLEKAHRNSRWRFRALMTAGNRFLLINRPDKYEPLYKAAYEDFPEELQAGTAHWKVTWAAYLQRKSDAGEHLRYHLDHFPSHPAAAGSLYYLGRIAENKGDFGAARAFYTRLTEAFPNYYYGVLARERLAQPKVAAAAPSQKIDAYLDRVNLPEHKGGKAQPTPATATRIERAALLRSAGFPDWAETELRFGAKTDGQPYLLAIELARTAPSAFQGLRYAKSMVSDYLAVPVDGVPPKLWQYLFPMPYRADLLRNAKLHNLDPFILAGLIRQESEFNPQAVSHANAYGLTQVVPATGRALARKNGIRRFNSRMLFQPATNLKLGTTYLRSILDQCNGSWEQTLAAYNAGKTRLDDWVTWGRFEEPAEFVETIPFTETREYVQAVLRNAAIYKQIYEGRLAEAGPEFSGKPKAVKAKAPVKRHSKKAVARKKPARRRK